MNLDEPAILPLGGELQMVPGDKWIRGTLGGKTVVDSRQFTFVWEIPYWPWWFFRRTDVDAELVELESTSPNGDPNGLVRYDLMVGDRKLDGAARAYPDSPHPGLRDLVAIEFDVLDHWFEEDVEVFVHPRSPFTRIDALASSRHVVVSIDGVVLAESHKPTVLYETGVPARFYLPLTDVNLELVQPNERTASCPYKGDSTFFSAQIGDHLVADIAWTYAFPRPESTPIAGLVSFYNEAVDIDIDGERIPRQRTHFT